MSMSKGFENPGYMFEKKKLGVEPETSFEEEESESLEEDFEDESSEEEE